MSAERDCDRCVFSDHSKKGSDPCFSCKLLSKSLFVPKAAQKRKVCADCKYENIMAESIPCETCLRSETPIRFKPKATGENMKSESHLERQRTIAQETDTAEDKARELLNSCGVPYAYEYSAGELVSLANLISEYENLKQGGRLAHPLYEAFDDAVAQATGGKGTRHGGGATSFKEQRWYQNSKSTGVGGPMFQMIKKAQEACEKDNQEDFERELLGALVYGGAAYIFVKQHGFKKV